MGTIAVTAAIDALLFDLDNTLADRDEAFARWARWFARERLGVAQPLEIEEAASALMLLDAGGHTPKDALFRGIKEAYRRLVNDVDSLVNAFRAQLITHLPPLNAGATILLAALDEAHLPWGIVTNGSSPAQRAKIHTLMLADRARSVVISEEIGMRKPDPEMFRLAASHLGVAEREILFVGDNPAADIAGAVSAGMQTAWLRQSRTWPAHLTAITPDLVIDALDDLMWVAERGERPCR